MAQLYSLQAVLPQVAVDLGVAPSTAALSVSAATLGIAAAVIPWSLVADRIGRVPAMAIGIIAATVLGLAAPLSYTAGTTVGALSGRLIAGPLGELFDWRVGVWSVTVFCAFAAVLFLRLVAHDADGQPRRGADV